MLFRSQGGGVQGGGARVDVEVQGVGPALGAPHKPQGVPAHGGDRAHGDQAAASGGDGEDLLVRLPRAQAGHPEDG